jgi:predicted nucleic acid-binding protein
MNAPGTLKPFTVFIVSSVLFAAAASPTGGARDLVQRSFQGQVTLYISTLVLQEVERNIARKAAAALPAFQALRDLLPLHLVEPSAELIERVATSIERKDAPIVAAAVSAGVAYLATHDVKHLIHQASQVKAEFGVIVATPGELLTLVRTAP